MGNVNYKELQAFKNRVEKSLSDEQVDLFIQDCAKELAARLLAKVIKRTPVGVYPKGTGKKGGTLRNGWTGGKNSNGANYAKSLNVTNSGGTYTIEIVNPVEYASYIEFGHRKRGHKGWVKGRFMLTISEQEIQASASAILESKLKKKLGECFK